MAKKDILVRILTTEAEATYGGQAIGFYDNPRTYTPKGKTKEVYEDRLYISIDNIGKKQIVKRKVTDEELPILSMKYKRAYDLYLAAKKAGGKLDETTKLIDTIADKNKAIATKEKEAEGKDVEIAELHRKIAEFEAKKSVAKTTKSE